MRRLKIAATVLTMAAATQGLPAQDIPLTGPRAAQTYTPGQEVRASQEAFAADRFGIFIHWGIYSMFGQGEWYLNYGPTADEYAKAAKGFYPAGFDAQQWARAIKDSGARYICFTSRHHDGFSMFDTAESEYDIVDGTPYGRNVLKELADACAAEDLALHLYYSHLDWTREDYPRGRTGKETGRKGDAVDWDSYSAFMDRQLTELLTGYGPVRCIWFDGWWDHDEDPEPFDWHLAAQYALVHSLQPGCMVGNNHHQAPFEGEDIQIFERDVPGENTAGYSGQAISRLPLETCQTMNGSWGYRLQDTDYKDSPTLIRYLVKTAGQGANLLLNIGPRPDGSLPEQALARLKDIGVWMQANGETIYGTQGSPFGNRDWGTSTVKGKRMFVHVTEPAKAGEVVIPFDNMPGKKIKRARAYADGSEISVTRRADGYKLGIGALGDDTTDYIVEIEWS